MYLLTEWFNLSKSLYTKLVIYPHGPIAFMIVLLAHNFIIKLAGLLGGMFGTAATPMCGPPIVTSLLTYFPTAQVSTTALAIRPP